jgi:hypothetical protein
MTMGFIPSSTVEQSGSREGTAITLISSSIYVGLLNPRRQFGLLDCLGGDLSCIWGLSKHQCATCSCTAGTPPLCNGVGRIGRNDRLISPFHRNFHSRQDYNESR